MRTRRIAIVLAAALPLVFAVPLRSSAQQPASRRVDYGSLEAPASFDSALLAGLSWTEIGPNRGGRSLAVGGSAARPDEYWFGATGGGLWKTTDGGITWKPVTDGKISSASVGAVAVAPSNPDVVYIGMGEAALRGSITQGDGVYRTTDGGETWTHLGLEDTQTIARIRVDPKDPDVVYVAALGHPYGPNAERGVFRSRDGGKTWKKVLFVSDSAGAVDLAMDPEDPGHAVRRHLAGVPDALEDVGRRAPLRAVEDHRRRRPLDRTDREPRDAGRPRSAESASPSRAPTPTACGPSSRPKTADCSARTTRAPRGRGSTRSGRSASAPSTSATSSPTPATAPRSTPAT